METGEIWDSIQSVAMALGVTTPWIGEVCNTHKGTVSGLHFCFVSDIAENTLENRQKMIADIDSNCKRIQKRPVRCIETGIVYESVTAAGKSAGVNRKRIEKV